jgi:hypothetical protein
MHGNSITRLLLVEDDPGEGQGHYFGRAVPADQFAVLLERGLLETVAAEDLERRIAALERELAERDRRTARVDLENARLKKIVEDLENANRAVIHPNLNAQSTGREESILRIRQQE